jgi:hypothetical protein
MLADVYLCLDVIRKEGDFVFDSNSHDILNIEIKFIKNMSDYLVQMKQ